MSINGETYGCLTAHYIEGGESKRCILHFEVHHGTTTGLALFEELQTIFESYNIDKKFIVAVATDTTGNMNTFGANLTRHRVIHLCCVGHNLHLNAKIAFDGKNLPNSGSETSPNAMKAARTLIEYFTKSTQAMEKLLRAQELAMLEIMMVHK